MVPRKLDQPVGVRARPSRPGSLLPATRCRGDEEVADQLDTFACGRLRDGEVPRPSAVKRRSQARVLLLAPQTIHSCFFWAAPAPKTGAPLPLPGGGSAPRAAAGQRTEMGSSRRGCPAAQAGEDTAVAEGHLSSAASSPACGTIGACRRPRAATCTPPRRRRFAWSAVPVRTVKPGRPGCGPSDAHAPQA